MCKVRNCHDSAHNDKWRGIFYFLVICLFLHVSVFAQDKDTTNEQIILNKKGIFKNNPLLIVDGKVYEADSLKNIQPGDIIDVTVLKYATDKNVVICKPDNGAVIITTRKEAISQYQKKLGSFSRKYKGYLATHKCTESDFVYVLNGVPLDSAITKRLYGVPIKKIKTVSFMDKYFKETFNNSKPIVLITTKN